MIMAGESPNTYLTAIRPTPVLVSEDVRGSSEETPCHVFFIIPPQPLKLDDLDIFLEHECAFRDYFHIGRASGGMGERQECPSRDFTGVDNVEGIGQVGAKVWQET